MAKAQSPVRTSGKTPADEFAAQEATEVDQPMQEEPPGQHTGLGIGMIGGPASRPEDKGLTLAPAFSRMRTDWNGPDREVIQQMHRGADDLVVKNFGEIYDLFYEIYTIVREPEVDEQNGDVLTDAFGLPRWKMAPGTNSYYEDWSRVGHREREMLVYKLTTGLFRWRKTADEMWAESVFARAQFEEASAHGFESIKSDRATIDDRTARARVLAAEYRYHAVYASYLSRRAESVVRTAELLGQRLKDLSS